MAKRPGTKKGASRTPAARRTATRKARAAATPRPARTASASRTPKASTARRAARPKAKSTASKKVRAAASRSAAPSVLFAPVTGAERRTIGHVELEVGRAGAARVKRMIYPPGFHWAVDMKPVTGTELCMHAHVGFLVHGEIHIEYADGCIVEFRAPQIVAIDPGHDGWVVGTEPVVMIEFDFERETVGKLGMPDRHHHG
jgi:hypothetical protein